MPPAERLFPGGDFLEDDFGIMPIGAHNSSFFGTFHDLAVEMVASERGSRYYEDTLIPDDVYEYADRSGRVIEDREDLDEVYEEYMLRR